MVHKISAFFDGWSIADIEDHIAVWRARGAEELALWIKRGERMVAAMEQASTIEEYDIAHRRINPNVVTYVTPRSRGRWETGEFQKKVRDGQHADEAVYAYITGAAE